MIKKKLAIFSKISITSIIGTAANIVKIKCFALVLGVYGFGIVSQLINLSLFVTFISTFGLPLGIIKVVSELESNNDWAGVNALLKKTFVILGFFSLFLMTAVIVFAKDISVILYGTDEYSMYVLLFGFSVPFIAILAIYDSILRSFKKFTEYSKVSILITLVTTALAIVLVLIYNINGVALNFILSGLVSTIIYTIFLHKKRFIVFRDILRSSTKNTHFKGLFLIGIASLLMSIMDYSNLIYLRSLIIKDFGILSNGIYQTIFSISNNYLGIFGMITGVYAIPVLASIKDDVKFNSEINSQLKIFILCLVPIIISIYVLREIIIVTLFSKEFVGASDLFFFNLFGDLFKTLGTIFGLWLIPKSKIKTLVLFNFVYNAVYFIFYYYLIKFSNFQLVGVTIAYMIGSAFFMIVSLVYSLTKNNFSFEKGNIKLLVTSFIAIIVVFMISKFYLYSGYLCFVPILILWLYISLTNSDIFKIYDFLKFKKKSDNLD